MGIGCLMMEPLSCDVGGHYILTCSTSSAFYCMHSSPYMSRCSTYKYYQQKWDYSPHFQRYRRQCPVEEGKGQGWNEVEGGPLHTSQLDAFTPWTTWTSASGMTKGLTSRIRMTVTPALFHYIFHIPKLFFLPPSKIRRQNGTTFLH